MLTASTRYCNSYRLLSWSTVQCQMMHRPHWSCWQTSVLQKWPEEKQYYLHTVLHNTASLFTKYYQNCLINVEDIISQSNVVSEHDWKDPISGVHVSQGSAETLVRRGEITNHHSIAYSLSNICAENNQNRLMCVEVIVYNVSVVIWDTVQNHSFARHNYNNNSWLCKKCQSLFCNQLQKSRGECM